jgi:hypothetical protein
MTDYISYHREIESLAKFIAHAGGTVVWERLKEEFPGYYEELLYASQDATAKELNEIRNSTSIEGQ